MERGSAARERAEKRRQTILDAYAEWLASFEAMLKDCSAYYGEIALEAKQGRAGGSQAAFTPTKEEQSLEDRFSTITCRLRLLERNSSLTSRIEQLASALARGAEDYDDLIVQSVDWPAKIKGLRQQASEVTQQIQDLYL